MFNFTKKLKKRPGIWPYFFDFFTVLLSVYLAFLITEWREEQKIKKEVKMAKERLNLEIFQNYKSMITFHDDVSNRLEKMQEIETIQSSKKSFQSYIGIFGGYQIARFKHAAWDRVSNSNMANLMSAEYVEQVHSLYEGLRNLEKHNDIITKILYSDMLTDAAKCKTAYSLSELHTWQQSVWSLLYMNAHNKFISEYEHYFTNLLQNDSIVDTRFMQLDTLKTAGRETFIANKRQKLNQHLDWKRVMPNTAYTDKN